MAVRPGVTLHVVEREPEMLPFVATLLRQWIGCGFEATACRRALDRVLDDPGSGASEALLNRDAIAGGGLIATDDLLYPFADPALRDLVPALTGHPRRRSAGSSAASSATPRAQRR